MWNRKAIVWRFLWQTFVQNFYWDWKYYLPGRKSMTKNRVDFFRPANSLLVKLEKNSSRCQNIWPALLPKPFHKAIGHVSFSWHLKFCECYVRIALSSITRLWSLCWKTIICLVVHFSCKSSRIHELYVWKIATLLEKYTCWKSLWKTLVSKPWLV